MAVKVKDLKYERIDVEKASEFIASCTARAAAANSAEELVSIREELNAKLDECFTMSSLAAIRNSLNVRDEFYSKEKDYYNETMPSLSARLTAFNKALMASAHYGAFKKLVNPLIIMNMEAAVRVMDDKIIDDCVEENKISTDYARLLAELKFPWNGGTVTIGEMRGIAKDADREVRKKAFSVIGETLASVSDKLDGYYDKLVGIRTRMAKKMGFADYVEMGDLRMGHIGYGRKEIAVFRESVLNDVVPALVKLKAALCKKHGWDKTYIYDNDNYIVGGNIDPVGTAEQLIAAAQSMYDEMRPELGKFFKSMCDAEAIDYIARDGKECGGYAEMIYGYGQPFIFANFNGTMDDVGVLTHELGHAYAFERAAANKIDRDLFVGSMETAETHSMGMEALCNRYNAKFYGDRADEATYQQIFDAFNFLPYGVIVDYFQELVYKSPEMTPAERKALWLDLEKQFRPYLDMSGVPYIEDGGRWQYQSHIYEVPFYYIDYCLSTCLALQFGELASTDYADALDRYLKLVEKGGTKTIDTLAHEAGLMSPFDKGALKKLCKQVTEHILELE